MIHQSIARKYAKGLFSVGEKDGKYGEYLGEISSLVALFEKEDRLGKALMLPILEMEKEERASGRRGTGSGFVFVCHQYAHHADGEKQDGIPAAPQGSLHRPRG